jgi:hypothetical protein
MRSSMMFFVCLFTITGCSPNSPSFKEMKIFYEENRAVFDEVSEFSCKLGEDGRLSTYLNSSDYETTTQRIDKLDALMVKVNGRAIWYTSNTDGSCSLSIEIYRNHFANNGRAFYYNYNLDSIFPYDKTEHTEEKIIESKRDMRFDMSLSDSDAKLKWYFTYTYS